MANSYLRNNISYQVHMQHKNSENYLVVNSTFVHDKCLIDDHEF